ncbi:hypothetical protein LTR17_026601 [Elasticomyces elasticus]|nr:hypothetical protein LTR17_026601 [Elasticomyces elasticus]
MDTVIVAALQCVERGLLELDDPIATTISEWTEPRILTGFDEDLEKPVLTTATNTLTLRHLLTHSSGMAYPNPMVNPLLSKCFGEPFGTKNSTVEGQFLIPLVYEPGERWEYSPGLEWAGKMVEKANGGMKLSEYLQMNRWDRLGMKSTTFDPLHRPDLMERLVERVRRAATGLLEKDDSDMFTIGEVEDDFGGYGCYTCARDFILILKSLLSDDGLLLGPEMRRELFQRHLARPEAFQVRIEDPILGPCLAPGLARE